jgi:phasin family protein
MSVAVNALSELSRATIDTAARLTRISMDNTERVISLQLQYAKGTLEQAAAAARAARGAKSVEELLKVRTRSAENAVEWLMNYSRSFYDVASGAQSELSKLAEERVSTFQQAVSESVDQAARQVANYSDAGVRAASRAKSRK